MTYKFLNFYLLLLVTIYVQAGYPSRLVNNNGGQTRSINNQFSNVQGPISKPNTQNTQNTPVHPCATVTCPAPYCPTGGILIIPSGECCPICKLSNTNQQPTNTKKQTQTTTQQQIPNTNTFQQHIQQNRNMYRNSNIDNTNQNFNVIPNNYNNNNIKQENTNARKVDNTISQQNIPNTIQKTQTTNNYVQTSYLPTDNNIRLGDTTTTNTNKQKDTTINYNQYTKELLYDDKYAFNDNKYSESPSNSDPMENTRKSDMKDGYNKNNNQITSNTEQARHGGKKKGNKIGTSKIKVKDRDYYTEKFYGKLINYENNNPNHVYRDHKQLPNNYESKHYDNYFGDDLKNDFIDAKADGYNVYNQPNNYDVNKYGNSNPYYVNKYYGYNNPYDNLYGGQYNGYNPYLVHNNRGYDSKYDGSVGYKESGGDTDGYKDKSGGGMEKMSGDNGKKDTMKYDNNNGLQYSGNQYKNNVDSNNDGQLKYTGSQSLYSTQQQYVPQQQQYTTQQQQQIYYTQQQPIQQQYYGQQQYVPPQQQQQYYIQQQPYQQQYIAQQQNIPQQQQYNTVKQSSSRPIQRNQVTHQQTPQQLRKRLLDE